MIRAYNRLGHGTNFVGAWTGYTFFLAAVLFGDVSDLLHMADETTTDEASFNMVHAMTHSTMGTSIDHRRITQARQIVLVHVITARGLLMGRLMLNECLSLCYESWPLPWP